MRRRTLETASFCLRRDLCIADRCTMTTSDERVREYRARADKARQAAQHTTHDDLRKTYLRLAKSWETLAQDARKLPLRDRTEPMSRGRRTGQPSGE
jgi:hypothetical protein